MNDKDDLDRAHKLSINHRRLLESSAMCGCFNCLAVFPPSHITDWETYSSDAKSIDETAACPKCHIDTVIPLTDWMPQDFLKRMNAYWMT